MSFNLTLMIALVTPLILSLPLAIGDWLDDRRQNAWCNHWHDTDWKVKKEKRKKNEIREHW